MINFIKYNFCNNEIKGLKKKISDNENISKTSRFHLKLSNRLYNFKLYIHLSMTYKWFKQDLKKEYFLIKKIVKFEAWNTNNYGSYA